MTCRAPRAQPVLSPLLVVLLLVAACSREPEPLPPLPGVSPGEREWFWRNVLAAPLPGEAGPDRQLLALEPPAALLAELMALSDSHAPAAFTTLMTALRHPQEGVACAAARELGLRGERAAIPRLIKSIGPYPVDYDVPITVRAASASALARLGNPAGVPLILAILDEGTARERPRVELPWEPTTRMVFVQELALVGLRALAGSDFGFEPNASIPAREDAAARAAAWWAERAERLWMAAGDIEEPGFALRVRLLVAQLNAFQLRQKDGALFTLAHLGPGVIPFLTEGLASSDDYVRLHVLDVMRQLAARVDRQVCAQLAVLASRPLLEDASAAVAARAAAVCGAAGVADPLIVATSRRNEPEVRLALIDALGATGLPAARDQLAQWPEAETRNSPDLAVALVAARWRADPDAAPDALLALLASADAGLAYPALERLVALVGSDCGVDPAQPPEARREAIDKARLALLQVRTAPVAPR